MQLGLSLGLTRLGGGGWTPAALGSSLLGWWDAERSDLITQSGGTVSSWRDVVAGYSAVQATGSRKPVYSATSFNSRPGLAFDGVDDYVELASQPFPSGSSPSELWVLVDQTALAADATARFAAAYGGDVATDRRSTARVSLGGTNRAQAGMGTGAAFVGGPNTSVDYSGRHVARGIFSSSAAQTDVDGVAGSPEAGVPATGTSRLRIGTLSSTAPANYWQGQISAVLVTSLLSVADAAQLLTYLKARGGIA